MTKYTLSWNKKGLKGKLESSDSYFVGFFVFQLRVYFVVHSKAEISYLQVYIRQIL